METELIENIISEDWEYSEELPLYEIQILGHKFLNFVAEHMSENLIIEIY